MAHDTILTGSNISKVRSHNLRAILVGLLRYPSLSRAALARMTGLSNTTITNLVAELVHEGIVVEQGVEEPSPRRRVGRPQMLLRLVPEARYAVGVSIGVGRTRVALTDLRATIVQDEVWAHPHDQPARQAVDTITLRASSMLKRLGVTSRQLVGLGVGASGLVDPEMGVNVYAPNLGWRDVPLAQWMAEALGGLPVVVDNNVRAMALGEALFGQERQPTALAFVYGRIGVGAGLVVNGQIYRGSAAGAGEIGHTTVVVQGGERCRCGNAGCLETLVSEPVILRSAEQLAQLEPQGILATTLRCEAGPTIERVFAAARAGDRSTMAMLQERAMYLGVALANLVNVFNPERIVLGGVFAQGYDLFMPTLVETVSHRAFANLGEKVQFQTPSFGHLAGVVGAAALALESFFYQHPEWALEVTR